jgi:hypothetical protein
VTRARRNVLRLGSPPKPCVDGAACCKGFKEVESCPVVNPFIPTFGTSPPLLVGRDRGLDDFREGLRGGAGSPERANSGHRSARHRQDSHAHAYEDVAGAEGWLVISESATPNLIDRITYEHLPRLRLLVDVDPRQTESHLTGVFAPGRIWRQPGDRRATHSPPWSPVSTGPTHRHPGRAWERRAHHPRRGSPQGPGDLRELGTTIQHAFRDRREAAFVGAGLPSAVNDLLSDEVSTFLRRADRRHLAP